jgi:hypothetical protein
MEKKRLLVTPNDYDKWFDDVVKTLGLCSTPKPIEYPCVVCWNDDGPRYNFVYLSDFIIE